MPGTLPLASQLHADSYLSQFAIAHGQDLAADYVADRACTVVPVGKQSDLYAIWSKADFFRSDMNHWAEGAPTPELGFRKSDGTYYAKRYGGKKLLTDDQRENARGELPIEEQVVRYLMGQAKIRRDLIFQATAFGTGLWTSNTEQTGVAAAPGANQFLQFNDAASDPLDVVHTQKLVVHLSTGKMPNVIVTDPDTDRALRLNPVIKDVYKYTQPANITDADLAAAFGVEEYIVAKSVYNTANEGQTATMARPWGKGMLIMYRTPQPTIDDISAVSLFSWSPFDFVTPEGAAVDSWFDDDRRGDWFRASQYLDMAITANDAGVFLLDTVA